MNRHTMDIHKKDIEETKPDVWAGVPDTDRAARHESQAVQLRLSSTALRPVGLEAPRPTHSIRIDIGDDEEPTEIPVRNRGRHLKEGPTPWAHLYQESNTGKH